MRAYTVDRLDLVQARLRSEINRELARECPTLRQAGFGARQTIADRIVSAAFSGGQQSERTGE